MPVGLTMPKHVSPVAGVRLAAVQSGIYGPAKRDLVLIELAEGSTTAAVFTQNRFCAAPVVVAKQHLSVTQPRYLLINSGNANAGTGAQGLADAQRSCVLVAAQSNSEPELVLPFSTGVIGQRLPVDKIDAALPGAFSGLAKDAWLDAARAIMTTDTIPKVVSRQVETNGGDFSITGMAKGAGMICPNMATMLAFVATDAAIDQASLVDLNQQLTEQSFNRITIDGDTSTNDACVLIATGGAGQITKGSPAWSKFVATLLEVYQQLAQSIVRDGEGASKFVTVAVKGGYKDSDCEVVARSVAHSPLVKTALFASDANWGRILAAVGYAGIALAIEKVSLVINGVVIVQNGEPHPDYHEQLGASAMANSEIEIEIELGQGSARYRLWTSDLSYDYVSINADYRT